MHSKNPATGEIVFEFTSTTIPEVNQAFLNARNAFPDWSRLTLEKRMGYLTNFASLVEKEKNNLAHMISKETGKPLWDSKTEVAAMILKVEISFRSYLERCREVTLAHPLGRSVTRYKPHGVLGVIGPYNFPGHLPNGHIVPALLAGNIVLFKPSELTPGTASLTYELWQRAGLPEGVLQLLQGDKETAIALSSHPDLDGLLFTGSFATGQKLSMQMSKTPQKILALEMGGNNPLVISKIEDIPKTVELIIQSSFLTSGQRCTASRRLIVIDSPQSPSLIDALIERTKNITVGPYTDIPEPFMGPVISEEAALKILDSQASLQKKGGKTLIEMKHLKKGTGFLSPALIDITSTSEREDNEIFGPLLQIIRVLDLSSAIKEANRTAYGLTAGLISPHQEEFDQFYHHIRAGIINWNTPLTGASSQAPFGGIGNSGNHRPSAYFASDYCSYPVASLLA